MPKRSAPEEPKILVNKDVYTDDYINSPYGNSYEVNWKIPADNGEPIDSYNVNYCVVSGCFFRPPRKVMMLFEGWRNVSTALPPKVFREFI